MVVPHPRIDTYALLTRPPLTELPLPVRLACVKHAASVRSEPGSNSQVHLRVPFPKTSDSLMNGPELYGRDPRNKSEGNLQSVTVRIKEDTSRRPYGLPTKSEYITHPDRRSDRPISFLLSQERPKDAANVSLPSLFICQRSKRSRHQPRRSGPND